MKATPNLRLFVLIDALGWQIVERTEFLSDLLPYRTPLRTILGYSSGAIPTILTGKLPAEHGHWNLIYYDPQSSPFRWLRHFHFLPEGMLEHRVTRKLLKELGRRALGLGPLFECCVSPRLLPDFNWVEKRNIYQRGGIMGARSIFDELTEIGVPHRVYSYHWGTDEAILRQVRQDLEAGEATFFFLYLSEIDGFLHSHCGEDSLVEQRLAWYASRLREVFEAARRRDPEASFTVFSDHGMTPVQSHYDLVEKIETLGFIMPDDYLAVYDSTMARFWFFNDRAKRAIVECLETVPCARIVPDDELRQLGVLFPDRRYGEVILLLQPGWLLTRSDFNGRGWMPAGMHGYHPDDSYSDAIFLSNQPPVALHSIADVYECMHRVLK